MKKSSIVALIGSLSIGSGLAVTFNLFSADVNLPKSPPSSLSVDWSTVIMNPLGIPAYSNNSVFTSVLTKDDRHPIYMNDPAYYAVGRLTTTSGGLCTATIVHIPGYNDRNHDGFATVLTAAHCIADGKGNIYPKEEIQFSTNYINEDGQMATFNAQVTDLAYNQRSYRDIAVLQLNQFIPKEITPANVNLNFPIEKGQKINAIGYSADLLGLGEHSDCTVTQQGFIISNCDISSGASGGPVTIKHSFGDPLTVIGFNSAIGKHTKRTIHMQVKKSFIEDISFLKDSESEHSFTTPSATIDVCLRIMVDGLNIRSGAGTSFPVIGKGTKGIITQEFKTIGLWSEVKTATGDRAYIAREHNGQRLATQIPCPK